VSPKRLFSSCEHPDRSGCLQLSPGAPGVDFAAPPPLRHRGRSSALSVKACRLLLPVSSAVPPVRRPAWAFSPRMPLRAKLLIEGGFLCRFPLSMVQAFSAVGSDIFPRVLIRDFRGGGSCFLTNHPDFLFSFYAWSNLPPRACDQSETHTRNRPGLLFPPAVRRWPLPAESETRHLFFIPPVLFSESLLPLQSSMTLVGFPLRERVFYELNFPLSSSWWFSSDFFVRTCH